MSHEIDILDILEQSAEQIRGLRQRVDSDKLMLDNITIRLAIHQLRHGPIDYKEPPDNHWEELRELLGGGRLRITSSAEVMLDAKMLDLELFHKTIQ